MYGAIKDDLAARLEQARGAGVYKAELVIQSPQSAHVAVANEGELLNLCANNYLGLANHPRLIAAAKEALDEWGFGMASVRFICGTQDIHRKLEQRLASFLAADDVILFSSCFDANTGIFEALLSEEDAIISDALNHASIIDGIRLCKARRLRYANADIDELEAHLQEASDARFRLIVTDGVFSMDGYYAPLTAICDLADRYDALVMVDDSHAVGFVGPAGRGTPALQGVAERVDIVTGTLGKALGGASGGYVAARAEIVDVLRQRARPYLFSNSLAPPIVAAGFAALDLIIEADELRDRLFENTRAFRHGLTALGFEILAGDHPIVPVMLHNERYSSQFARALLEEGVYAVSFSFPVVPRGGARIRTQMSAAHTAEDIEFALGAFERASRRTL